MACISVVLLHANASIHRFSIDCIWWFRVFIEVVFFFAVPVFFMLSGATLLDYRKRYTTKIYYKKRLLKVVIPFIFWSIIFYLFYIWKDKPDINWHIIIQHFITGEIPYTAYWFFVPLILLYIFIPFLSLMTMHMTEKCMIGLILVLFAFQILLPLFCSLFNIEFLYQLPIGGYFLYMLCGYYIAKYDFKNSRLVMIFLGITSVIFLILRYILLFHSTSKLPILFSYFGLYAFFPAIFIFLIVKQYHAKLQWGGVKWLSKRSYGVYLFHRTIIWVLAFNFNWNNPWFIPFSFLIGYSGSLLITWFLQKWRITRILVP